jgi:hypothetical protein
MQSWINYLINPDIPFVSPFVITGVGISLFLLISGILIPVVMKRLMASTGRFYAKPELWLRLFVAWAGIWRWLGLIWLLFFLLRYEGLPPFTMRIWVYIVILPFLVWMWLAWQKERRLTPALERQSTRHEHYDKYLPRPKSKRV